MVKQTHSSFSGGPSAVVFACRRRCVVGKLPCDALNFVCACTDRLLRPCHHPPVSSHLPRECLVGWTMAPSQLQGAPTPRRCARSETKRTKHMSVVDIAILDNVEGIFTVHKAARTPGNCKNLEKRTFSYCRIPNVKLSCLTTG